MDAQVHGVCSTGPDGGILVTGRTRSIVDMAHVAPGAVCCFVGVVGWRHQAHGGGGFVVRKAQLIHLDDDTLAVLLFSRLQNKYEAESTYHVCDVRDC